MPYSVTIEYNNQNEYIALIGIETQHFLCDLVKLKFMKDNFGFHTKLITDEQSEFLHTLLDKHQINTGEYMILIDSCNEKGAVSEPSKIINKVLEIIIENHTKI